MTEPAIIRNEYIDRATAARETIGNEGSQVDEACAKLDGALDRLGKNWAALASRLQPVTMDETPGETGLLDASPEPPKSRVARFITNRAEQISNLADTINHHTDMVDL